jgi:antibiotic biosynthesis monooxygenase (ABM) superfamily enzyme
MSADSHNYNLRSGKNKYKITNNVNEIIMVDSSPTMQTVVADGYTSWIQSPVNAELTKVPGIGKSSRDVLEQAGITTTWQLMGKFLMMNRDVEEFRKWLRGFTALSTHCETIINAINNKINILFGDT